MYRGSGPRIFPIIVVIVVVALIIAAIVSIGRMVFTGTSSTKPSSQSTETVLTAVHDTANSRSVRWTVRGPIVADENFKSYQISISPTSRTFTTYAGYLGQVIEAKTYSNNKDAYEQFVYALEKADIGKTRSANDTEFRGVCATEGFAFMFETLNNRDVDHSLWTSTCSGSKGTMSANIPQMHALFINQIPDFKPVFNNIY